MADDDGVTVVARANAEQVMVMPRPESMPRKPCSPLAAGELGLDIYDMRGWSMPAWPHVETLNELGDFNGLTAAPITCDQVGLLDPLAQIFRLASNFLVIDLDQRIFAALPLVKQLVPPSTYSCGANGTAPISDCCLHFAICRCGQRPALRRAVVSSATPPAKMPPISSAGIHCHLPILADRP